MEEFKQVTQAVTFCIKRGPTRAVEEVLVARKKLKIGAGCFNGYGGNREAGENVLQCAVRELDEETSGGITADSRDLKPVGCFDIICIPFKLQIRLWVFLLEKFEGEPQETDEMEKGQWLQVDSLQYDTFMPADREFLPRLLAGEMLMGDFTLDNDTTTDTTTSVGANTRSDTGANGGVNIGAPKSPRLKVVRSSFVTVSGLHNLAELTEVAGH